jgi:HAE1 family hydrophobic/amphiphilic exporter-1
VITSSILMLVVLPVVYTVLEDRADWSRAVFRRKG